MFARTTHVLMEELVFQLVVLLTPVLVHVDTQEIHVKHTPVHVPIMHVLTVDHVLRMDAAHTLVLARVVTREQIVRHIPVHVKTTFV